MFSHPADYIPVCNTELEAAARLKGEFEKWNCKIIGLSVDTVAEHHGWEKDIEETQGQAVNFPRIADKERFVATAYGMIYPKSDPKLTVRSVFVIGADKKLKQTITCPPETGRNFDEILRVVDTLQLTAKHKVATPLNWKQGEDVIIVPAVSNEEAKTLFTEGLNEEKSYLRTVPQPGK